MKTKKLVGPRKRSNTWIYDDQDEYLRNRKIVTGDSEGVTHRTALYEFMERNPLPKVKKRK